MTTGLFAGKFLPPHRGHITSILRAATMCDRLYVVICERKQEDRSLCLASCGKYIDGRLRKQWLQEEFLNMEERIQVRLIDESDLPPYPDGWAPWAERIRHSFNDYLEPIDLIFGGEHEYAGCFEKHFPGSRYQVLDPSRSRWPISGTLVRQDPILYWDYIIGPARPFFALRVLVTGTESCGKTTLVKTLAKIYHTSWSEEVGRDYALQYLGGDETIFTDEDFRRIAHLQYENDFRALRSANRVCFIDTDAVVTDYYSQLYMGHCNPHVRSFVDPNRYDAVFLMKPDVPWVADGQRLNAQGRNELHARLKGAYEAAGFTNLIEIGGHYDGRLEAAMTHVDALFAGYRELFARRAGEATAP